MMAKSSVDIRLRVAYNIISAYFFRYKTFGFLKNVQKTSLIHYARYYNIGYFSYKSSVNEGRYLLKCFLTSRRDYCVEG